MQNHDDYASKVKTAEAAQYESQMIRNRRDQGGECASASTAVDPRDAIYRKQKEFISFQSALEHLMSHLPPAYWHSEQARFLWSKLLP
jgi:hypothetical protein